MECYEILGGRRLEGTVRVHGAKNSVLPILCATLLAAGVSVIHNCPRLSDVDASIAILRHLGCRVEREGTTVTVDAGALDRSDVPEALMREMRSSVIFLGAILARTGRADVSMPGGCELGPRPIDLHLAALKRLGAEIEQRGGSLLCHGGDAVSVARQVCKPRFPLLQSDGTGHILRRGGAVPDGGHHGVKVRILCAVVVQLLLLDGQAGLLEGDHHPGHVPARARLPGLGQPGLTFGQGEALKLRLPAVGLLAVAGQISPRPHRLVLQEEPAMAHHQQRQHPQPHRAEQDAFPLPHRAHLLGISVVQ